MNVLRVSLISPLVVAALSIVLAVFAGPTPSSNSSSSLECFHDCFFSRLVGLRVENQDGQRLGRLKDCVLDMESGQTEYGIITGGGFVGWGRRSYLVPANWLTTATAKKEVLGLVIPRQQWLDAPVLHAGDLAEINREHLRFRASNSRRNHKVISSGSGSLSSSALVNSQPFRRGHRVDLRLASDLLGKTVLNGQKTKLGEVSNFILDLNDGKPACLVLTRNSWLGRPEQFVVPLRTLSEDGLGRLIVQLKASQLSDAPAFNEPAWQKATGDSGVLVFRLSSRGRA